MKLASLKPGIRYKALSFGVFIDDPENEFVLSDPVIASAIGDEVPYGSLFAYLFRRFGYPNYGWDNYKELTKYRLTTPHPDLILEVVPFVGDTSVLSFSFFLAEQSWATIEAYDQKDGTAWLQRAFDWRESQGLPDWMPTWIQFVNETLRPKWRHLGPDITKWGDAISYALPLGKPEDPYYQLSKSAWEFRAKLLDGYAQIEARPKYVARNKDWNLWPKEDPLLPFVEAARIALLDLRRPVRVRDSAINAFGETEPTRNTLKEPPVAGKPSGDLANRAPEEFVKLHQLVLKLGKGNAKKGIAKVLALAADDNLRRRVLG